MGGTHINSMGDSESFGLLKNSRTKTAEIIPCRVLILFGQAFGYVVPIGWDILPWGLSPIAVLVFGPVTLSLLYLTLTLTILILFRPEL
jgi:hypothetical protein